MIVDFMTHLNYDTLLNYLENRLSAEERDQVELHLAGSCRQCDRRFAHLQTVLQSVASDRTAAPPEAVLQRAIQIGRQRKSPQRKPWERIVAGLSFDSHLQLSFAATRGVTRTRQMLFTTDQVDIDLQIKPGRTDSDLLGQMLSTQRPVDVAPAFVSLQSNTGGLLRATETDSLGQFAFRQIPPGTYDLIFDLENQEVAITGLEFKND